MEIWANAKTGFTAYLDTIKSTISWIGNPGYQFPSTEDARQWLRKNGYILVLEAKN